MHRTGVASSRLLQVIFKVVTRLNEYDYYLSPSFLPLSLAIMADTQPLLKDPSTGYGGTTGK